MKNNWMLLVKERCAADPAFRAEVEGITDEMGLKVLLEKEGLSYDTADLPELLAGLKGWRERGRALSDLELDALSGGVVNCYGVSEGFNENGNTGC